MKNYKGVVLTSVFLFIVIVLLGGCTRLFTKYSGAGVAENVKENIANNKVAIVTRIPLEAFEIMQLASATDRFMNEYKLPKGVQSSYDLLIDKRLNNSIRIVVNESKEGDDGNVVLYASRVNEVWTLDPNAGPWCTLEEFDKKECY
jgi:hypothetical protein